MDDLAPEFTDFARARDAFLRARVLDASGRSDLLATFRAQDRGLALAVTRMLALSGADASTPSIVSPSPFGTSPVDGAALVQVVEDALSPGEVRALPQLRGYAFIRALGHGSHAEVWEAVELDAPRRRVAIKMLAVRGSHRRFSLEGDALGRMSHDGIARIHSAGTTGDGRGFLVMELIEGLPFTNACDALGLGLRDRVRLLVTACHALQHAHECGVLHRDLKPSNLLVGQREGAPFIKVIDFGIAKALEHAFGADVAPTIPGQILGTPAYMSPEQRMASAEPVGIRADVYSLGTILFEAATGRPRWDLEGCSPIQALDRVSRVPPRAVLGAAPSLAPDLVAIIERSLAERPAERYASMAALAADLERWLRSEPVEARRAGMMRRAGWAVRRHPLAATLLGAGALLSVAIAAAGFLLYRAERQKTEAQRNLIGSVVGILDGVASLPGTLEHRDALSAVIIEELEAHSDDRPEAADTLLADVSLSRSDVLRQQGDLAGATELRRRAVRIREFQAAEHPDDLEAQRRLALATVLVGDVEREGGDIPSALDRYREAHRRLERLALRDGAEFLDRSRLCWSFDRLCEVLHVLGNDVRSGLDAPQRAAARREARSLALAMERLASSMAADPAEQSHRVALHAQVGAWARLILTAGAELSESELTALHDRCVAAAAELVATSPKNRTYAHLYAARLGVTAAHHALAQRFDTTERLLERSTAVLQTILDSEPDNLDSRCRLTEALTSIAYTRRDAGDLAGAREALVRAQAVGAPLLIAQPRNPAYVGVMGQVQEMAMNLEARDD